jgi:hypothetical protein
MLIPLFICIKLITADGLPPNLSQRPHHRLNFYIALRWGKRQIALPDAP